MLLNFYLNNMLFLALARESAEPLERALRVLPSIPESAQWCNFVRNLDELDLVLVKTVEPGFGGQKFIADMLEKVRKVRAEIDRRALNVHLQMDGGIGPVNAGLCIEAGGRLFVAGTSVFRAPDAAAAIDAIRNPSK